ncbi:MAG: hypothetical protein ACYDH9_03830 [Limisphaerales bacterium]
MSKENPNTPTITSTGKISTRHWYAWNDLMPPKPNHLHVVGEAQVGNPGVVALLSPKEPQGINPAILLLDLHLVQQPGNWTQQITWAQAGYTKIENGTYHEVAIYFGGKEVAKIPVEDVH